MNMNLRQLHTEVSVDDSDATIAWFQRYGLVAMENNCKNCHQAMNMVKRSGKDGKHGSVEGHVRLGKASEMTLSSANQIFVWQQLLNLFTLGRTKN